ncbi:MAG: hypothetical protein HYS56_03140 [Candidatus Omnitrophica bacterium]|nr:hypothetical protein [Candidatus Omnitrophota bacterium]
MKIIITKILLLVSLATASPALACPMCKDVMKAFGRLTEGWFWSILLMLAIPFTLVGVFAGLLVRSYRKSRR